MNKLKQKLERAQDRAWFDFAFKAWGVVVAIAGLITGNPFLAYLGISIGLHETAITALDGGSWGGGAAKGGADTFVEANKGAVSKAIGKIADGVGALGAVKDAFEAMGKFLDAQELGDALRKAREANAKMLEASDSGKLQGLVDGIRDLGIAKAQALADADKIVGEPVITPGGGGRSTEPDDGSAVTPSGGGASTDGVDDAADGGYTDVPTEIDPPGPVPVTVNVSNFGRSTFSGAVSQVRVFKEPGNRSVLLVVDESDGANVWFEEALTDIGVAYDIVFVDTQYTPVYQDADPLTKDLKDYEIVLWETSNDRSGTLANPAQPELRKYLADQGCLFLGGDGFMAEWPARSGTLMADWMFADGYGGDTFDLAVDGVRGTIGDGLSLVLAGGTGSSLQTFGTSLAGVKPPRKAAFLYNKSLAAIQGENETANGTYKTVLFSFSFDSISDRILRDETMRRVIDYLACKPVASGATGVPDIPWPIPREPPWIIEPPPKVPVTVNIPLPPGVYVGELFVYTPGPDTNRLNNDGRSRLIVKPEVPIYITSCQSITQPGSYLVTQDLSSTGSCINIFSDGVSLDGGGHTIFFGVGGGPGTGIMLIDSFGPD